jgi:hypothetical protein
MRDGEDALHAEHGLAHAVEQVLQKVLRQLVVEVALVDHAQVARR